MKNKMFIKLLMLACVTLFVGCGNDGGETPQVIAKPEPTPIGIPVGDVVSAVIGPNGGSITSVDGIAKLDVPPGALSGNTTISVRPITNMAPGGTGNGYSFGPDGTKFSKPATLTFHYSQDDIAGTLPVLLGIAFQNAEGVWYSLKDFIVDVPNQTISTTTPHFTGFAFFKSLQITPSSSEMKVSEHGEFVVMSVEDSHLPGSPSKGDDELSPLHKLQEVSSDLILNWSLNGLVNGKDQSGKDGGFGEVTPHGSHCNYTAPIVAPHGAKNPVQLSADIKINFKDPVTGGTFNRASIVAPIKIIGDFKYNLTIRYKSAVYTGGLVGAGFLVADSASIQIVITDNEVICSNFTNSMELVTPTTKMDPFGNKSTWLPPDDGLFPGELNITACVGNFTGFNPVPLPPLPPLPSNLFLTISGTSFSPGFEYVGSDGKKQLFPGASTELYQIITLNLNDSIPKWESGFRFQRC